MARGCGKDLKTGTLRRILSDLGFTMRDIQKL